jgi:hypothetical protein
VTRKPKTIRHEYTGPGEKPEAMVITEPPVPVFVEVMAEAEAVTWQFSCTEMGRRYFELLGQHKDGEVPDEDFAALVSESGPADLRVFRARNIVGVAETLEHLQRVEIDGKPSALKGEDLQRWVTKDPTRWAELKKAAGKLFSSDDGE